jgi:hypothetical protein
MAFGPSCEFAPLVPARITFHPRWLSRGSASPQHMRRARSPKSAQPSRRSLAAPARRRCRLELRPWGLGPLRRFAPERASRKEAKPSAALTRFSLRSLPLIWIGTGFPALALLRFLGGVPFARCGSASGPSAPDEVPRGPGSTCWCSLGIALQGFLAALAHGFVSRAILLHALRAATLRPSAPGALESCATAIGGRQRPMHPLPP